MRMRIFLIGGFTKTAFLANSLLKQKHHVTAINEVADNCAALAEIERLNVFKGDGSKPFVLEDANIQNADIAIALTNRDEDNLVICQLCKKQFGVKKTVALISDPKKIDFFYRMGVDSVVSAVTVIASVIEQHALLNQISALLPIGEGKVQITQVNIPGNAPIVNNRLSEINLPKEVIIGCILRGETIIIPYGDTLILEGDELIMISSSKNENVAIMELTGK